MILREIEQLEAAILDEVAKRRKLGGYSAEAEAILLLAETLLRVLQHLRSEAIANEAKVDGQPKRKG